MGAIISFAFFSHDEENNYCLFYFGRITGLVLILDYNDSAELTACKISEIYVI